MSINQATKLKDIKIKIKTSFNSKVHLRELGPVRMQLWYLNFNWSNFSPNSIWWCVIMLLVEDRVYGEIACIQFNLKSKHLLIPRKTKLAKID